MKKTPMDLEPLFSYLVLISALLAEIQLDFGRRLTGDESQAPIERTDNELAEQN